MDRSKINERQRLLRQQNGNAHTKKYEKTPKGFVMRLYRNMQSRVQGIQWQKKHLYENMELLPREEFYQWILNDETFKRLYESYVTSGYQRKLAPSVDRLDSSKGYIFGNMEIVTMSENSRRGAIEKSIKYYG
jgi:hypothetical protein